MSDPIVNTMQPGLKPGDKLKHFEVQDQLGAGGMGIVWRGYDRLLDRHVAVKQIASADKIDEIARQKFRAAAELQKKISAASPNLVQVIDLVDDPRGLFMIMEFIDGPSVDRLLNQSQGPVDPLKSLMILRDAAQGLAALHAAGVIHRDLKPGNILISPTGGAKLCDFDLATVLADQESMAMGTAQYMAPEMFSGNPVDARADLYSLGMVAYELLAGRTAFREAFKAIVRDPRNQAMRWMKWHTNLRVAAPALKQLNPQVPDVLADLVGRLMAKDPAQRIDSASLLLEAIKRHFSKATPAQAAAARQQAKSATGTAAAIAGVSRSPLDLTPMAGKTAAQAATDTAPLPKRGKLVYILASVTVVMVLLIGFFLWKQGHDKQLVEQAAIALAQSRFDAAKAKYHDNKPDYAGAKAGFDELAGDPHFGVGAQAYSHLAVAQMEAIEGEQAMKGGDYAKSSQLYGEAAAELEEIEKLHVQSAAEGRFATAKAYLDREITNRKSFVDSFQEIRRLIAKSDYDNARTAIDRILNSTRTTSSVGRDTTKRAVSMTEDEKKVLTTLAVTIAEQEQSHDVEVADQAALSLISDGKLAEAKKGLEKALQKFGTAPRLKDRLRGVEKTISMNAALADAKAAESSGDLQAAVTALERANEIEASKEREDKVKQLRSTIAFNEGAALEKGNDPVGAAAKYQAATNFWPNKDADQRLSGLKLAGDRTSMLTAADNALAAADYQQAINLFESANKISATPDVVEKIQKATVRLSVIQAEGQLKAANLAGARASLEKALAIDPADGPAKTMLGKLEQIAQFNVFVNEADKLRAARKYGPAKETYQKAINLAKDANFDAKEIVDRKLDTEYEHLIAQSRAAISNETWTEARGLLASARKMKQSDVVDQLIAEVESHVKPDKK